jgi:MtN3 and saliva related transmembrane protein
MNNYLITAIGLLAACLTTFSFLPQAIKVIRTRKTEGISLWMYALFCLGTLSWLIYGISIGDLPVILANAVTLALSSAVLFLKIKLG